MGDLISEHWLHQVVSLLVRFVEIAGAAVIFVGAVLGFARFLWALLRTRGSGSFTAIRLQVGRFLALGLEFQLASDLLRTAVAPTWEQIGQLAAVAAIRTALNYFLGREIREEQVQPSDGRTVIASRGDGDEGGPGSSRPPAGSQRRAPAQSDA